MTENNGDHNDAQIEKLIRRAVVKDADTHDWPLEECIHAYLTQTATEEQIAEVRGALGRSSSLRREIVLLAEAIERLSTEEAQEAYDARSVPDVPSELIRSIVGAVEPVPTFRERLADFFRRRQWALAVTAAAAVVILLIAEPFLTRQGGQQVQLTESGDVVPEDIFRKPPVTGTRPADPRGTAIKSLSDRVAVKGGGLLIVPEDDVPIVSTTKNEVVVALYTSEGQLLKELIFDIPHGASNVEVWIMPVPNRELQKVALTGPRVEIRLPEGLTNPRGVVTLTYEDNGALKSTGARSF